MKSGEAIHSPEFELVLACLRWPQQAADGDRIRSLAQQPLHWSRVLAIVHHHKVVQLFARNLDAFAAGCVPDGPAAELRASVIANAHTCLQRTSDLLALNRLFRHQSIDLRIFKGIPLAMVAFHDPTLRDAGDIDLLLAEKDIAAAHEILLGQGYLRFDPQARLTPRRLRSYLAHQKDFSYEHPGTGAVIDLHWRLFRNPWLPANARIEQRGEDWIHLGPERVPTLPTTQLLVYLCVHGALDGWLRLKWLADIAALLRSMSADQIRDAAAAAVEQQASAQFSAAVILCQDLLGIPPLAVHTLDRNHAGVAHILRFSKQCMTSNHCCPVREGIPSAQWFLNELRLHNSMRYRMDLVQRSLFRPRVWHTIDLPDALFPLYAFVSPVEWLTFHLRNRLVMLRHAVEDLALTAEAVCMLSFFRVALSFLPAQRLTAWMSDDSQERNSLSEAKSMREIRRVQWSIGAVVRHAPMTFVCFPQCLAAYFMLRRRHIASKLFYGVMREANQLKAHTWVKVGDRTIVGGDVESQFTVLNTFP